jgi:Ni2+-binding GTPase involved in maturation of urease and hydrogenase
MMGKTLLVEETKQGLFLERSSSQIIVVSGHCKAVSRVKFCAKILVERLVTVETGRCAKSSA